MIRAASLLLALSLFAGCRQSSHTAAYRFSGEGAYSVRYEAALTGKAEDVRGARPYDAEAKATLSVKALPDSAAGRIELSLAADSVSYQASDRDNYEGRYMQERLRRYKAKMVLSSTGQVLSLEEEPDLPPVDFSPLNFGRFLAYGLPAFPKEAVKAGSEWTAEQPLLDKFHPGSKVIKRYKVRGVKETAEGRLLECAVTVEAWLEDGLGVRTSSGDSARPALSGRGETVFNLDRGLPVSAVLELEGHFITQVPDPAADSGRVKDQPVRLGLRLDLRFGGG